MKKKKRTLMHILLLPLLLVVLFQGILPFSMLLSSGVKSIMESNAVDLDSYLVENSKVILENAMIEQWSAVRKESNYLNSVLSDLLKEQRADIEKFTKDKELQKEYTQRVFPELLESLRRDTTCGVFLVMANDQPIGAPGDFTGFFLRDSDPVTKAIQTLTFFWSAGIKLWPVSGELPWIIPGPLHFVFREKVSGKVMIFSMNLTQQVWLIQG